MNAQAKPIGPTPETALEITDVVYPPEVWTRPEDQSRPYSFRVQPSATKQPKPSQFQHGGYEQTEVTKENRGAGAVLYSAAVVYKNKHTDRLGKLKSFRVITPRQWASGIAFRRTWERVNGSISPSRDSTIPSIGGTVHETEQQAEMYGRDRARLATIYARVGPGRYALLIDVCCFDHGIGSPCGKGKAKVLMLRALLCEALDQCAVAYGIHEEGGC